MNKRHLYIGRITIIYGLLYILLDGINYLLPKQINDLYLVPFPLENLGAFPDFPENRFVTWIFIIVLINAGYFITKRDKNSWFLYNIALTGLICKEIVFFIFKGDFYLKSSGTLTLIISVVGFIYINLIYFEKNWNKQKLRFILRLFSIILINLIFILLFTINRDYKSDKYYFEGIINASTFNHPNSSDTCLFAKEFLQILDSIDPNDRIKTIKIVELHSDLKPKYSELISRFSIDVVSEEYYYGHDGFLEKIVSDGLYNHPRVSKYVYYENGLLKKEKYVEEIDGFQTEHFKYYIYTKVGDTILGSYSADLNYAIINELDENNEIIQAIHRQFNFPVGIVNYIYDQKGILIEVHGYNIENELLYVEKNNYSGKKLKSKEKYNYLQSFDYNSYSRPLKNFNYKEITIYKN